MTRLSITDLPPKMRQQALKKIADQEKEKSRGDPDKQEEINGSDDAEKPKVKNKYKAKKIPVILPDGTEHVFDSAKEARVYNDLLIRLNAGDISDLRLQVEYELIPKQKKLNGKSERNIRYIADFVFVEDGKTKVVDVKGYRRGGAYAVFVIKRKLMLWIHGIEVEER